MDLEDYQKLLVNIRKEFVAASQKFDLKSIDQILGYNVDYNGNKLNMLDFCFQRCIFRDDAVMAKYLIEKGLNLETKVSIDEPGFRHKSERYLHLAARRNALACLKLLAEQGMCIRGKNGIGQSPYQIAVCLNHQKTSQWLKMAEEALLEKEIAAQKLEFENDLKTMKIFK